VSLLAAATGTGASQISVLGTNTSAGRIGVQGYNQGYFVGVLDNTASFQIKNAERLLPDIEVGTTGQITLGSGGATSIVTFNPIQVGNAVASSTNDLVLSPLNNTNSVIYQGCATNGVITIGSSLASSSNIQIFDTAGLAATVIGGNSGAGIRFNGGVGSAPASIYTNVADAGTMTLGSSASVPDSITMTDGAGIDKGRTSIKNLVPPPALGNNQFNLTNGGNPIAPGAIPQGTNVLTFSNPGDLVDGLYWFGVNSTTNAALNTNTMAVYSSSTGTWRTGGTAYGAIYLGGNLSFVGGGANMLLVSSLPNATTGTVSWIRIFTGQMPA
jgi:hypothetical protein